MFKKKFSITAILFISWQLNAQVALPTFQAVQYAGESALYSFSSHTFTNCGATGRTGPTLANCKSSYNTSWEDDTDLFNVQTQGIQEWTVPQTGTYTIEAYGAKGGGTYGGKGAKIVGDFSLSIGDVIKILVGQRGVTNTSNSSGNSSGGGGGTYVIKSPYNNTSSILVIAGGGGGEGVSQGCSTANLTGVGGGITNNGLAGNGTRCGPASIGTNGNGATKPSQCNHGCSGGAGFFGNSAEYASSGWGGSAYSFTNGGQGANQRSSSGADGGFGGGGAGAYGGGGGGGYSGGGTGDFMDPCRDLGGGGGGYYNSGSSASNTANNRAGYGQVIINL